MSEPGAAAPVQTFAPPPRPPLHHRITTAVHRGLRLPLWPFLQARGRYRARKYRLRQELVADVARYLRMLEAKEAIELSQRQIALNPGAWKGIRTRCDPMDGGCGQAVDFPPLRTQVLGDRQLWKMTCPACRKQRVVLATTPELREMQASALDEFKRKGQFGEACERYGKAVFEYQQRLNAVRREAAKSGAGDAPEAAVDDTAPLAPAGA